MARFSGNPLKNPLAGTEIIPATDVSVSTGNGAPDVGITPNVLAEFVLGSFPLASDTGNGLMSSEDHSRLYDTYTKEENDAFNALFKKEAIGIYIGTVADGYIEFYSNVLDDLTIISADAKSDSGTVTAAVQIAGVSITGLDAIAISSTKGTSTATAANALANGVSLGITFSANAAALGVYLTILAYKNLP